MQEHSTHSSTNLPEGCGYNFIFKHQWKTHTNSLPITAVTEILKIVDGRQFGWHFIPHDNMNYHNDDWYKDQTLVLSFSSRIDLIITKLIVTIT